MALARRAERREAAEAVAGAGSVLRSEAIARVHRLTARACRSDPRRDSSKPGRRDARVVANRDSTRGQAFEAKPPADA